MRYNSTLVCATIILTAIFVTTGETASVATRIFKGRNTRNTEYPFLTWIEYQGTLVCSGTLVGEEWVLTAAQCVENPTLTDYRISVGDTLVSNKNDGQLFFEPDTFFVHPDYNSTSLENAVALIRLPEAVNTAAKNIGLIPELRTTSLDDIIANKDTCVFTGFGETTEGTPAKRKTKLTVRIIEDSECSDISHYNDSVHMCFQSKRKGSKNRACLGDEGAPIICDVNDQEVLMGFSLEGGCENLNMPGLEIPSYVSWIQQIMDANSYERCLNLPEVTNGSYVLTGSPVVNGNATLKCDDGLSRTSKDITIICQAGGNWTDMLAVCGCGNPPNPFQGDYVPDGVFENAVNTNATLVCNEGFATNVTDKSITCSPSGNWTSTDAVCLKTCGDAPEVENGSFECCTRDHFVGDTAVLRCDEGYIRSTRKDDKATIECKSSGQWSSASNIKCNKACDALPEVLNGTFEVETYDLVVGDSALLICDAGFLRSVADNPSATIACEGNGTWASTSVTCQRSCGAPSAPSNGTFNLDSSTLVNDTAVLACDQGFLRSTSMRSEATITCGSDGQWTNTSATCIQGCGNVTSVNNGEFVSNGTNVGDEAILTCNYGYSPSSENQSDLTITCEVTSSWTTISEYCVRTCFDPPAVVNGSFVADSGLLLDDTAVMSCDWGFVRSVTNDSDATITCEDTGSWTTTSAYCIRTCFDPPAVVNGSFVADSGLLLDDTAVMSCDWGFVRSVTNDSDATITCEDTGSWTTTSAYCIRTCFDPPAVVNGSFVADSGLLLDDTAVMSCDWGFVRSVTNDSDATITCEDTGSWTTTASYCIRTCFDPPAVVNGSFVADSGLLLDDTAVMSCDWGFVRSVTNDSDATITCEDTGSWTTTSAYCIRTCFDPPAVVNGSFVADSGLLLDDTAVMSCDWGFVRSVTNDSDATITCEDTGSWTTTSAYCIRTCFDPPAVVNGSFVADSGLLLDDTAVMECDWGFVRSVTNDSDATITCDDTGSWTTTSAYCIRTCFDTPTVINGSFVADSGLLLDDTAVMSCDWGFVRSVTNDSDATITCEDTGSWTTTSAYCIRTCFDTPTVINGSFVADSGLLLDDTAVMSCDWGFVRSVTNDSDATITCEDTGSWTTTSAYCIRTCFDTPAVVNGTFNASGLLLDDTAVMSCDYGFVRSVSNDSDATITCEDTGDWTTTSSYCIRTCFDTPAVVNGTFNASGLLLDDTAVMSCDYGFVRSVSNDSDATITCEDTGNWTTTAAHCIRTCFDTPAVVNGTFNASGLLLDDTAVMSCDYGFVRSATNDSDATITCEDTGNWTTTSAYCIRTCFDTPAVVNGTFNASGLLLDDTAVMSCDYGFVRSVSNDSDATITCEDTGNWTTTSSYCIRTCFDTPAVVNGTFNASGLLLDDTAVMECDYGFVRSVSNDSDATITCEDTGNWTTTSAYCIRTCFDPIAVINGTFNASGLLLDDTAVMSCDYGFVRSVSNDSDATITCEDTGNWTTTAAHCIRTCFGTPAVVNGTFNASGLLLDDTAVMSCDYGFVRSVANDSDATITCEDTGNWTTTSSYCIRTCFDPPAALNGSFNASGLLLDDTAVLGCDYGYVRSVTNDSDATITCEDTGNWTTTAAHCIRTCFDPPAALNGSFIADSGLLVNDTAVLSCDELYVRSTPIDSEATLTCQSNGNWTTTSAYCIRTCPGRPEVDNGVIGENRTYIVNDTAELVCNTGYTRSTAFIAEASITCQENGNWTSPTAYCVESCSSAGTSFLVGFFKNAQDQGNPFLFGSVSEPASITITIPAYSYAQTVEITKLVTLSIPDDLGGDGGNVENKGIQITSNISMSLSLHHSRVRSAEGTLILPESCAKTEHLLITHNETSLAASLASSQCVTVALEDNTDVTIVEKSGLTVTRTLNRYDVFHHSATDLSGALVTSSKNVAVYAGHTCANVPDLNVGRCDYIIEQVPPVNSLRRAYLLTYQKPRPYFSVRVVAAYDDTDVYFWNADGTLIESVQLQSTDSHFSTYLDSLAISITSSRDILVAQYAHGHQSDRTEEGDPSYVVIPSLTQFLNEYTPLIDGTLYTSHYLALYIKDDDNVSGLRLGGNPLTSQDYVFAYVPGVGNFTIVYEEMVGATQITEILNHVNSTTVFGAMQYGYGDKMGYALMAGRDTPAYF